MLALPEESGLGGGRSPCRRRRVSRSLAGCGGGSVISRKLQRRLDRKADLPPIQSRSASALMTCSAKMGR